MVDPVRDLDDSVPAKLAQDAHDSILSDILNCRLRGGTIVQERRLALALGVSRSPLRDALGRLEGEGLLVRLSPRLLTVRAITLPDYLHAIDVRALLEPHAAALAATALAPAILEDLQRDQSCLEGSGEPPAAEHWAFDDRLHAALADSAGNPLLAQTIRTMRRWTTIYERHTMPNGGRPGTRRHRTLLDAVRARNPQRARVAMADHLAEVRAAALADF